MVMVFTEQQRDEIIAAFREKAPAFKACPVCGKKAFSLQDGMIPLTVQKEPGVMSIGGPSLPCVGLICDNCGNTVLINLMILGLRHLLEGVKS